MRQLLRVMLPMFLIIAYVTLSYFYDSKIEPVPPYPIWMKSSNELYSQQTSGIFFLGQEGSKKMFLTCNDNGRIDRITIDDSFFPPKFDITVLNFQVSTTAKFFTQYSKMDFEDIVYDKTSNLIYISLEGNTGTSDDNPPRNITFKEAEGVLAFTFNNTIMNCDTITSVSKFEMPQEIYKYTNENIAFEGMAVSENYFFMGLENITDSIAKFSDSTYIYIIDKKTQSVKAISSKKFNEISLSGLYATDDYTLYGVNRDSKKVFYIKFNPDFTIKQVKDIAFELTMPFNKDVSMDRMMGIEGVSVDNDGYIYTVSDPWSELYSPESVPKNAITEKERKNLIKLVPVLYKYENPFK